LKLGSCLRELGMHNSVSSSKNLDNFIVAYLDQYRSMLSVDLFHTIGVAMVPALSFGEKTVHG
jgi:hypothetical protein